MTTGRPWPSQTAWSLEFSRPLVRPMHRPSAPPRRRGDEPDPTGRLMMLKLCSPQARG